MVTGALSQLDITEIENRYNVVYRGFVPNCTEEYRGQEHTNVKAGGYIGWFYADGTLVIPLTPGCAVFTPDVRFTAASPEALDALLQDDDKE